MSEDRVAPRTASGKRLMHVINPNGAPLLQAILAIEAEAVKQGAAEGFVAGYGHAKAFYEAASLDSDELRKAVEALNGKSAEYGIFDDRAGGWSAAIRAVLALLSAGDKAEAPRHSLDGVTALDGNPVTPEDVAYVRRMELLTALGKLRVRAAELDIPTAALTTENLLALIDGERVSRPAQEDEALAEAPHKLLFPPHPDGFYGSSALCSCGFFQWDAETAESVLAAQAMVTADWQTHVAGDKAEAPTSDYLSASEQRRLRCVCGHGLIRHTEYGCIDCGTSEASTPMHAFVRTSGAGDKAEAPLDE